MEYIICFILSTILVFISEKLLKKNRKKLAITLLIISVLILCLLAGLRDVSIGTDVNIYVKPLFENAINAESFQSYISENNEYTENAYLVFTFICAKLTTNINVFLFIIQLLIIVPVYYAIYLRRKEAPMWLSLLIYLTLMYNVSFNLVRQCIAMSFIFLSYSLLEKNKRISTVICIILAFLFHKSALIAICTYVIILIYKSNKLNKSCKKKIIRAILFLILFSVIFYQPLASFLYNINILPDKYYTYIKRVDMDNYDIDYFNLLYKLFFWGIIIYYFYNMKKNVKMDKPMNIVPYATILAVDFIIFPISFLSDTFIRIGYYYGLNIYPLAIPLCSNEVSNKKEVFIRCIIVLAVIIYWIYSIMIYKGMQTYPYILGI